MKQIGLMILIVIMCFGCSGNFDIENPDVRQFVTQLKDGSYNQYYKGEDGENLWTVFPEFTLKDIPLLLEYAKDTTLISPCDHFPVNPISSIPPWRADKNDKSAIMLGEYLLWSAETIINGHFPSLTPLLRQASDSQNRVLNGKEILIVRQKYLDWWNDYGKKGNVSVLPLSGTDYLWM